MKKFLATIAIALGGFSFVMTTHAATFTVLPNEPVTYCDLVNSYLTHEDIVKGSYVEAKCKFHVLSPEVTVITSGQEVKVETDVTGRYRIKFKNVKVPKGNVYFVYQKLYGEHTPSWNVEIPDTSSIFRWAEIGLPDLSDTKVHHSIDFSHDNVEDLSYVTSFGCWNSGEEKIAIFMCAR